MPACQLYMSPDVSTVGEWGPFADRGLMVRAGGSLPYGEIQCIICNSHMVMFPLTEWQTDTTENITFATLLLSGKYIWMKEEICVLLVRVP